jgi:DNA-directed RNA polymerase
MSTQRDRELTLEDEAISIGKTQFLERTQKLVTKQYESQTRYGRRRIAQSIEPLTNGITAFLEGATRPGRRHAAVKYLKLIDPKVAALLTARVVLDSISTPRRLVSVCKDIGARIEDELRFEHFENEASGLYSKVQQNIAKNPLISAQQGARRATLAHAMRKFEITWNEWPDTERVLVGAKLLDILMETTGWVRVPLERIRDKTHRNVEAVPEFVEWVLNEKEAASLLCPFFLPMIVAPLPWTSITGGGYYNQRLRRRLVRSRSRGYLEELKLRDMPEVYQAANALQSTAWKVNTLMLTVVEEVWNSEIEVKDMPSEHDIPLPPKPHDIETNKESRSWWKRKAADVYRENRKRSSRRIQFAKVKMLAQKFAKEPVIYFPAYLDFRGRMYFVPPYLNPQGSDMSKSLLCFAESKPLGESGAKWLKIHVANMFGHDKVSLEDRVKWTEENASWIIETANDPVGRREWLKADKPFQFLAAAIEFVGYTSDGPSYSSSLPILVDGSCNGLQHFSAMLRDPICGKHVNLIPSDKPSDIYSEVAHQVVAALRSDTSAYASKWMDFGIDRKMCKRPVMVLPYGGTLAAVQEYVTKRFEEVVKDGTADPFDDKERRRAIAYLSKIIWSVMKDVVYGPRVAMDYLRKLAQQVAKEKSPVFWTTPSGFLVNQTYRCINDRLVKARVGDEIIQMTLSEGTDRIDVRKQSQAIAPNFVHSLDAACLVLTINRSFDLGIRAFSAIHDSYGTHAADTDTLMHCLRQVFVSLYQEHDVLDEFTSELIGILPPDAEVPAQPEKGTLDLEGVLKSDFFFA